MTTPGTTPPSSKYQKCKEAYEGLAALERYASTLPAISKRIMSGMIMTNRAIIDRECESRDNT